MKKLSIGSLMIAGMFFMSCNGSNTEQNSMDSTNVTSVSSTSDTANVITTTTLDETSRKFIENAAHGGMMEVNLGNLAMNSAKSQDVKDFGKMMVDDHTSLNNSLKDIATRKNFQVPLGITLDQQNEMDDLTKKTGKDFDQAYVNMMVNDHKKDIADFKNASENLTDSDLKSFAGNAIPTLQKHLDAIQDIQKKM